MYYDCVLQVEAYWCFRNYIEQIQEEFTEQGMIQKIGKKKPTISPLKYILFKLWKLDLHLYKHYFCFNFVEIVNMTLVQNLSISSNL